MATAKEKQIEIEQIYISYSDPDYYFGLNTVKESFPNAKVYATAANIARIKASYEAKLEVWGSVLGDGLPEKVIIPDEVQGEIDFAGSKFTILGSDPKKQTLYDAGGKVALGGPLVSTSGHEFMADTKSSASQKQWAADLAELQQADINVMIPSHFGENEKFENSDIQFVKDYVIAFTQVMNDSKNSQEIITKMKQRYPELPDASLELSAKVVTGEMEWNDFQ